MAPSKYTVLSDLELVNEYKKTSDNTSVGVLFERYTHLVFGVCMKYLKDEEESRDAVMQIFEKLLADLKRHEIAQFKGWLHSVAKNYCLMHLRSRQSTLKKEVEMQKDVKGVMENDYEQHLNTNNVKEEQLTKLEDGIKQLNEEQKICIELFYLQNKCYQEVTDITGYSLNQVKSFIQNGKRNLKIFLTATTNG
jgi:RNA polymerase sigma factor (sigma-70 family)